MNSALQQKINRRQFLNTCTQGIGATVLASFLGSAKAQDSWAGVANPTHFKPRAKRVIFLCMAGGPSHLESFDF